MTDEQIITVLGLCLAIPFVVLVLTLARRHLLTFRYVLGWFTLSISLVVATLMSPVLDSIASGLRISTLAVVLTSTTILLFVICLQLSVSISGLARQIKELTQEVALLSSEKKSSNTCNFVSENSDN